jgi:hypothetical protein
MLSLLFKRVLPKGTSTVSASPPVGQTIKYKNNLISSNKTDLVLVLLLKRVLQKDTSIGSASPPAGQRIKYQKLT